MVLLLFILGFFTFNPDLNFLFDDSFDDLSTCSIGFTHKMNNTATRTELIASRKRLEFLNISHARQYEIFTSETLLSLNLGKFEGSSVEFSVDRNLNEITKFGVGVSVSRRLGVIVKLKFSRLNQKFSVPLILSQDVTFKACCAAVAIPIFGYATIKKFIIKPWQRKLLEKQRKQLILDNEKRKKDAESTIILLQDTLYSKLLSTINSSNDSQTLFILSAVYGDIIETAPFFNQPLSISELYDHIKTIKEKNYVDTTSKKVFFEFKKSIDVTVAVQGLLLDNKLSIPNDTKASLNGFYDPLLDKEKHLEIIYQLNNDLYKIKVSDRESLFIPHYCIFF